MLRKRINVRPTQLRHVSSKDEGLVEKVFGLDGSIRFCGVIKDGKVIAGGMKKGLKSLEPASQDYKLMTQISILIGADKGWDTYMGKTDYFLIRKSKVNLAVFPIPNLKGVFVSSESAISTSKLDRIRKAIDAYEKSA